LTFFASITLVKPPTPQIFVIPAQAGIQFLFAEYEALGPAFAGMTNFFCFA